MKKLTKQQRLNKHLKSGKTIDSDRARTKFGICATAYHRRIGDFRDANPDYKIESKWMTTKLSRYKIHWAIPV